MVTAAHFFDLERGVPCLRGPLYQAVRQFLPLLHAAFDIGVAEGALDDLIELASGGHQQQRTARPMRDSEAFQLSSGVSQPSFAPPEPCIGYRSGVIGVTRSPER